MRNFTSSKIKGFTFLCVLFFALLSFNVFAKGTPVSANAANITCLLSAPDLNSRPFFNDSEDNRSGFTIANNGNQNLYFGFDMMYMHKILFSYIYLPFITTKLPLNETFKIIS